MSRLDYLRGLITADRSSSWSAQSRSCRDQLFPLSSWWSEVSSDLQNRGLEISLCAAKLNVNVHVEKWLCLQYKAPALLHHWYLNGHQHYLAKPSKNNLRMEVVTGWRSAGKVIFLSRAARPQSFHQLPPSNAVNLINMTARTLWDRWLFLMMVVILQIDLASEIIKPRGLTAWLWTITNTD